MRPFGLILSLAPLAVFADVKFTSPAAGNDVAVGTIDVQWEESGIAPSIQDLTGYTLVLMVGGNEDGNMLALTTFVSQGTFASGNQATGTIQSGIAAAVPNGFFFKIISSATDGGTVINYSNRFTITGLNGVTDETYRSAAAALGGSTNGPPSVGDAAPSSTTSTAIPTTTAATSINPTTIVTTTRSRSATSTTSHTPSSDSNSGGLSSGVLAGIAIAGVVVGLIGLAFGLWMCLRRRRRRDSGMVKMGDDNSNRSGEVFRKEMTVTEPVELDPYARIVEADHGAPPAEMDSMNVRVELEGDPVEPAHKSGIPRPDSILTEVPQTPISPMTIGTGTWDSMRMPLPDPTPTAPGTPVTPVSNV